MDVKNWLKDFLRERDVGKKFFLKKDFKIFFIAQKYKSFAIVVHVKNNHI